jgi:hypothetical protein
MAKFDRYAPAICLHFVGLAGMGVWFGAVISSGGRPITAETYGPYVHAIPAWFWVVTQVSCGALAALGCVTNRRLMAGFFGSLSSILVCGFAALSMGQPEGTLLQAGAMMWAGPLSVLASLVCWFGGESVGR